MDIEKEYVKKNVIKAIDIHNQHKAKLFEMSNNIIENKNTLANIYIQEKTIKIPKQGEKEFGYLDIHWFELCVTHLAFHIMENPSKYMEHCLKYAMISDKELMEHPIDYLYREYLLIKELYK